jgi:hypothetical protein
METEDEACSSKTDDRDTGSLQAESAGLPEGTEPFLRLCILLSEHLLHPYNESIRLCRTHQGCGTVFVLTK